MVVLDPNLVIPSSMSQFVKSILCGKLEDSDEFKVQCIMNQCPDCGDLSKFPLQNENIDELTLVSWMTYEYVTYQNKKGAESKRIVLKESELWYDKLMNKFYPWIYPNIQHCLLEMIEKIID